MLCGGVGSAWLSRISEGTTAHGGRVSEVLHPVEFEPINLCHGKLSTLLAVSRLTSSDRS